MLKHSRYKCRNLERNPPSSPSGKALVHSPSNISPPPDTLSVQSVLEMSTFLAKLSILVAFATAVSQAAPLSHIATVELKSRQAPGPFSGEGTFYDVGLGSCGFFNVESDAVVAIAASVFDTFPGATANPNANPVCGRQIVATANGISQVVTVVDRCPGCAAGDLDFSRTVFSRFASVDAGRIPITWSFA